MAHRYYKTLQLQQRQPEPELVIPDLPIRARGHRDHPTREPNTRHALLTANPTPYSKVPPPPPPPPPPPSHRHPVSNTDISSTPHNHHHRHHHHPRSNPNPPRGAYQIPPPSPSPSHLPGHLPTPPCPSRYAESSSPFTETWHPLLFAEALTGLPPDTHASPSSPTSSSPPRLQGSHFAPRVGSDAIPLLRRGRHQVRPDMDLGMDREGERELDIEFDQLPDYTQSQAQLMARRQREAELRASELEARWRRTRRGGGVR